MRLNSSIVLAFLFLAPALSAQAEGLPQAPAEKADSANPGEPATHSHWHLPRKRVRDSGPGRPDTGERDWNPLSGPTRASKAVLLEHGIRFDVDTVLYDQQVSETAAGHGNLGTFAWQNVGDWQLGKHASLGTSYLGWTLLGSPGLNYDSGDRSMSGDVGSISGLNANVYPDSAALDELHVKHASPDGKLMAMVGRVDLAAYFDSNRSANDAYRQFFAFALENNLSIPWSIYGGLGALVRVDFGENFYVMLGGVNTSDEPWAFWRSLDEGNWYQIFEIGFGRRFPHLGMGHFRITPWHNHVSGSDGWGVGLNFDQELGLERLVAFFRFGTGDDDVTPVERFCSGGLAFERPFGRQGDRVSVGVAWSNPSPGAGLRNETLLEIYYRLALSPSIALTPDLQIVIDPADNLANDTIAVGGIRLEISF